MKIDRIEINPQMQKEDAAQILGRIVERTGRRPSEAVIQLLKKDPKLMDAFFDGAREGDRQRQDLVNK